MDFSRPVVVQRLVGALVFQRFRCEDRGCPAGEDQDVHPMVQVRGSPGAALVLPWGSPHPWGTAAGAQGPLHCLGLSLRTRAG